MKYLLVVAVLNLSSPAFAQEPAKRKPASSGEFGCTYTPKVDSFLPALTQDIKTRCNVSLPFSITEATIDLGGANHNKTWVVCCTNLQENPDELQ